MNNQFTEQSGVKTVAQFNGHEIYFVGSRGYYRGEETIPLSESLEEVLQILSEARETPITAILHFRLYLRETGRLKDA